jgi:glycosyltransferase involved in cell wall biosynthesis
MKALINVYNEAQFISVCLESLKECTDEIVIDESAYQMHFDEFKKDYLRVQPRSTKGIRDYSRFER